VPTVLELLLLLQTLKAPLALIPTTAQSLLLLLLVITVH
jgi:hypothetical protein